MRALIVVAAALLIVWQGGCLTVQGGAIFNRCGLWQFATGKPFPSPPVAKDYSSHPLMHHRLVIEPEVKVIERERVIERIIEKQVPAPAPPPQVIYRDRVIEKPVPSAPPVIIYQYPPGQLQDSMMMGTSMGMIDPMHYRRQYR